MSFVSRLIVGAMRSFFHTRRRESAVTALAAEATAKLWAPPLERILSLAL
jgi:hypothetical protein